MSEFEKAEAQKYAKEAPRFREAIKNKPDFFAVDEIGGPVIPGSSLRGMLRNLLEMISYSKFSRVNQTLRIFYRAVADESDDSLKAAYENEIGRLGKKVKAGYLSQRGTDWYIQPAPSVKTLGLNRDRSFEVVKEEDIAAGAVLGLRRLKDKDYKPGYFEVSVMADLRRDEQGNPRLNQQGNQVQFLKVVAQSAPGSHPATLVCSGNMRETENAEGKGGAAAIDNSTLRHNHVVLAKVDSNTAATAIKIHPQAVEDYLHSLTPFQKEYLHRDEQGRPMGVLQDKRPVFYVEDESGEVRYFGHNRYFRIPALLEYTDSAGQTQRRAAVPHDFVPWQMRRPELVDYADAIFGFIRTNAELQEMQERGVSKPVQGAKDRAYASRVFVTDARLAEQTADVFLPLVEPRILASPKPSAYPHYLVQTDFWQEDLKHYGSMTPDETIIRGHKLYWLQGNVSAEQLQETDNRLLENGRVRDKSTQHTRMKPVRSGVRFTCRLYFENLSDRELGALCWTLHPLGTRDPVKDYCHRLGMGKPFGMGAVQLDVTLHLARRTARYATLLTGSKWTTGCAADGERLADRSDFVREVTSAFEQHILNQLKPFENDQECFRLADLKRIGILLKMMEWPGFLAEYPPTATNRLRTIKEQPNPRYLTIELEGVPTDQQNEYKNHPVLPDPSDIRFGIITGTEEPMSSALEDEATQATDENEHLKVPEATVVAPPQPSPESEELEWVTLINQPSFMAGAARVRTSDGIELSCEGLYRGMGRKGEQMQVIVTRKDGLAIRARVQ